jgi:heme-degrading monooxygenase HmoA
MHVQVATYRIPAISDREFIEANREFAEAIAQVPGLLAKIWLKAPDASVYGGVYLWESRAAYEAFAASELWYSVVADDTLSDLVSHDFEVMGELTGATQPGLLVVEGGSRGAS